MNTCLLLLAFACVLVVVLVLPPPQATTSMAIRHKNVGKSPVVNFLPGLINKISLVVANGRLTKIEKDSTRCKVSLFVCRCGSCVLSPPFASQKESVSLLH